MASGSVAGGSIEAHHSPSPQRLDSTDSPEFTALRKSYRRLVEVVSQGNIPGILFEEKIISDIDYISRPTSMTESDYGSKLMQLVLKSVKLKPTNFKLFCNALESESNASDVLKELKRVFHEEHQSLTTVDIDEKEMTSYNEVKCQLKILHKTYQTSSSTVAQESAITLIKDQMKRFMEKSLKNGLDPEKVKSDVDALCYKDSAVPSILLEWVNQEFEDMSKKQQDSLSSSRDVKFCSVKCSEQKLRFFDKETLYHAGLCCEAVATSRNQVEVNRFFNTTSPNHNLAEVSFSDNPCVHPYLIAKHGRKVYVAFKGEIHVSELHRRGYDEALKVQASRIPVRFFTELLWSGHIVILTGFSFGGLLACCVMANLWNESRISSEILLRQTTCITFGVPFLNIQLIDQVLKLLPDLKKCIHSVFLKEDLFPQIMGYLRAAESTEEKDPIIAPQAGAPKILHQHRVYVMVECLKTLQEDFLNRQKVHAVSESPLPRSPLNVTKHLISLKEEILGAQDVFPEDIVRLVYGAIYVIVETKVGLIWEKSESAALQILALQLTFEKNVLGRKIDALHQSLFKKHVINHYNKMVLRSYLDQDESYAPPSPRPNRLNHCKQLGMLIPTIKRAELHEYPKEQVLVVEGENLWFSSKIVLDEGGEHETEMSDPHNVTKLSLQYNFPTSKSVHSLIKDGEKVKITLQTHFLKKVMKEVECIKKPYSMSVRQMQLAKLTPSQVIKLAYLSTLLEQQQPQTNATERNIKTICFLDEAVKVVPVESVLDAVAYADHKIAVECVKALKASKLTLQPTRLMIKGLMQAIFRAKYGTSREVEDMFNDVDTGAQQRSTTPSFHGNFFGQVFGFSEVIPSRSVPDSDLSPNSLHELPSTTTPPISQQVSTSSLLPFASSSDSDTQNTPSMVSSSSPLFADVVSGRAAGDTMSRLAPSDPSTAVQLRPPLPVSVINVMQIDATIIVDPTFGLESAVFPEDLVEFLLSIFKDVTYRARNLGNENLEVVGKRNLDEIYPASGTIRRNKLLESPRCVLAKSIEKLAKFIQETQIEQNLAKQQKKNGNMQMLKYINTIYSVDVARCAALLGSFMERCIEIPFLKSPEDSAKAVSSPIAVGVWALFSLSREELEKMLRSSNKTELVIKVKEYMQSVLTDENEESQESEERMYAGKLQFLLQGMHKMVTSSTKYVSYSLELQLCNNLKFEKDISVQDLVKNWQKIFKNDVLFHVAESFRPLLARWLKWTILIHDLREMLAKYTCISVTGLINSGKSLLVKQLFDLKMVQVGTLKSKQTTVPLLYDLNIDALNVIDFPGMDDNDESVPDLAELMLTLSQMIIFVVDYRRISATAIKLWLEKMKSDDIPVLVCLTHADNLYLECVERDDMSEVGLKKKVIENELQSYRETIGNHHSWEIDFYSFSLVPTVKREDLDAVGIKSIVDVGRWLVSVLRCKLDLEHVAEKLEQFLKVRKSSCSNQ